MLPGGPLNLSPLEELDALAGAQLDDGLLPARPRAPEEAAPLRLRLDLDDVHALDLDVEQLLDCVPHLRLVRVRMDLERVPAHLGALVALLGDDRREADLRRVHLLGPPLDSRQRCL